mmetsp:Transcript_16805/g.46169  ORF Transcript_16805/g.46169 Transcript_16805/m.46169 type:complete len:98 (-) Transcript_16805:1733-2026(-)
MAIPVVTSSHSSQALSINCKMQQEQSPAWKPNAVLTSTRMSLSINSTLKCKFCRYIICRQFGTYAVMMNQFAGLSVSFEPRHVFACWSSRAAWVGLE